MNFNNNINTNSPTALFFNPFFDQYPISDSSDLQDQTWTHLEFPALALTSESDNILHNNTYPTPSDSTSSHVHASESSYEPEDEEEIPKVKSVKNSKKIVKNKVSKDSVESREPCKTIKRNLWTAAEDAQVVELVRQHGTKWALVASHMENRTGKQVRDRYVNYLVADIKTDVWTPEEDDLLIQLYYQLGNKWRNISTHIEGRTENQVKSRFYTHLKKRALDGKSKFSQSEKAMTIVETPVIMKNQTQEIPVFRGNDQFIGQIDLMNCEQGKQGIDNDCDAFIGTLDSQLMSLMADTANQGVSKDERFASLKERRTALEAVLAKTLEEINALEHEDSLSVFLDF